MYCNLTTHWSTLYDCVRIVYPCIVYPVYPMYSVQCTQRIVYPVYPLVHAGTRRYNTRASCTWPVLVHSSTVVQPLSTNQSPQLRSPLASGAYRGEYTRVVRRCELLKGG